jgi:nucleotide-binding universal stress UspA family protein
MGLVYKNIIAAIDGSQEAKWAFNKAVEMAKRNNAVLHLVHILDTHIRTYPGAETASIKKTAEHFGIELMEKYKKLAQEQGLEHVDTILEFGSPKVEITKNIAKRVKADLIVCGAEGLHALERLIIGSVAESITRTANCDVLVVRMKK